jgi:crotonobetainyl-CoA:carnitine CoA-transferase CaiB-like acyl-CoA transferase
MLLGDLGAEIIKIENPDTGGDIGRYVPPYTGHQDSLFFQSFNRNKKSITLNLKHPRSNEILRPLVANSQAVMNNLRGDLPDRLGLTYRALGEVNPAIVCCSLSAFGRGGARAGEPGYDYLIQGYAGWMSLTGDPDAPPAKSGLSLVDLSAGEMAALGTVSAILGARATGAGCDVDVSLFNAGFSQLAYLGAWHLTRGYQPERLPDSAHPSQVPCQVLPTKDGWMVVMCAKEKFYRNLVVAFGAPHLAEDPRFSTFADRLQNREDLVPVLKELSRHRTTAEWLRILAGRVPCAPVNTVEEALADPQVAEDQMILEVPHPEFGTVRQLASPIKIGDSTMEHKRGPRLGEHTEEVLHEYLHLSRQEIDGLRGEGVI